MATQPYKSDSHVDQQTRLVEFLRRRFSGNPRLQFANLGQTIHLRDATLAYDGMHLTAEGNRIIAEALLPHVRGLVR